MAAGDESWARVVEVGAIFGGFAVVVAGITIAMMRQFAENRKIFHTSIKELALRIEVRLDRIVDAFQAHEQQDQARHTQNIERFHAIEIKMARKNGHLDNKDAR